jgi:hypothetical protein
MASDDLLDVFATRFRAGDAGLPGMVRKDALDGVRGPAGMVTPAPLLSSAASDSCSVGIASRNHPTSSTAPQVPN